MRSELQRELPTRVFRARLRGAVRSCGAAGAAVRCNLKTQFVPGAAVTPALARQLGPRLLGQWFADDTNAVMSSALWRRLGGGREIIGRAITLDERRYTVSGVMPPAFRLPIVTPGL